MRAGTTLILAIIAAGCIQRSAQDQGKAEIVGKVIKIIDGDTLDVLHSDAVTTRIRLNGIDAPERGQAFGTKSKEHLSGLVRGQAVRVVDHGQDRFGRTIGDVYSGDVLLNLEMVRDGFAWHFKKYSDDLALANAEIEARASKRGLWFDPNPIAPWDYRRRPSDKK